VPPDPCLFAMSPLPVPITLQPVEKLPSRRFRSLLAPERTTIGSENVCTSEHRAPMSSSARPSLRFFNRLAHSRNRNHPNMWTHGLGNAGGRLPPHLIDTSRRRLIAQSFLRPTGNGALPAGAGLRAQRAGTAQPKPFSEGLVTLFGFPRLDGCTAPERTGFWAARRQHREELPHALIPRHCLAAR
jgi:hypothetical protein